MFISFSISVLKITIISTFYIYLSTNYLISFIENPESKSLVHYRMTPIPDQHKLIQVDSRRESLG